MKSPRDQNSTAWERRRFIGDGMKLLVLGSLLPAAACNNKSGPKVPGAGKDSLPRGKTGLKTKHPRGNWSHEGLVMNNKTRVLHFPTRKVYRYYDEIKPNHLQEISLAGWVEQLQEPVRLNRAQSGNILEILALQHLLGGVNDENLAAATGVLSKAFMPACENSKGVNGNTTHFRLHELMLQLLALNTSVTDKWQAFSAMVKKPDTLRKRQQWMAGEANFNERVRYILAHQTDYMNRLTERARRYAFT